MLLIHVPYHDTFLEYLLSILHDFMWSVSNFSGSVSTRLRVYFFSCPCNAILYVRECATYDRSLIVYWAFPFGREHFTILLAFSSWWLFISLFAEFLHDELCLFLCRWNNCATFKTTFFAFIMVLVELRAEFLYGVEVHKFYLEYKSRMTGRRVR